MPETTRRPGKTIRLASQPSTREQSCSRREFENFRGNFQTTYLPRVQKQNFQVDKITIKHIFSDQGELQFKKLRRETPQRKTHCVNTSSVVEVEVFEGKVLSSSRNHFYWQITHDSRKEITDTSLPSDNMSKRKEQDSTCMIPKVELKGGSVVGVTGSVLGQSAGKKQSLIVRIPQHYIEAFYEGKSFGTKVAQLEIIDEFKVENTECVQPTCLLEECEIGSKKDESEQIGTSRVPESSVINTERVHEKTAPLAREAYLSPAKLVRQGIFESVKLQTDTKAVQKNFGNLSKFNKQLRKFSKEAYL